MKILAFETTAEFASVALWLDGELHSTEIRDGRRHAETVLDTARSLLEEHKLCASDMDAFAVDIGPGSFTGVRIGVAYANALGYAAGKPVIAINSLEAIYEAVTERARAVSVQIDARNGNCYAALFQNGVCIEEPSAWVTAELCAQLSEDCLIVSDMYPGADSIAKVAAGRLETGTVQQSCVLPLYLRPSQAERMLAGK